MLAQSMQRKRSVRYVANATVVLCTLQFCRFDFGNQFLSADALLNGLTILRGFSGVFSE